jgi:transmembrane 9 superfamily protein 2/4
MSRAALLFAVCLSGATAFYLPGVSPQSFKKGEPIAIKVNRLTSTATELPFDYYSLPFVKPEKGVEPAAESLGEYLTGHSIENSPYIVPMLKDMNCQLLKRVVLNKKEQKQFVEAIHDGYHVNWIMDNLPSAAAIDDIETKTQVTVYDIGFPIGKIRLDKDTKKLVGVELNNHHKIVVAYHPVANGAAGRIVGFLVEPISVQHKYEGRWNDAKGAKQLTSCYNGQPMPPLDSRRSQLYVDKQNEVIWTYDVIWRPSEIQWASRWDIYLSMAGRYDDDVHWFSIINAVLIVLFLSALVAMVLLRSLRRDIAHYNRVPTEEDLAEEREETGWKLLHRDVFRPPQTMPLIFVVLVGSGAQLTVMSILLIILAAVGFVSPANRGSTMVALILLYVLTGAVGGYCSSRLYKFFKGKDWQRTTILTGMFFPGVAFVIFFTLNLFVWGEGSTRAVPIGSMFAVLAMWFCISMPLVFFGAYIGYRKDAMKAPVNTTSNIARPIPDQPWYLSNVFTIVVAGVLPFGAIFVELWFILSSLWLNQFYYVFGFLLLVWVVTMITVSEVVMMVTYFQLCAEDYHWWWRSFFAGGSLGIYVYLYSIYYFFANVLKPGAYLITCFLYFGYMFIISFALFCFSGTVGFYSAFWFCEKIFSSVKVD